MGSNPSLALHRFESGRLILRVDCCRHHCCDHRCRAAARDHEVGPARRALVSGYRAAHGHDESLVPSGTCQPLEDWQWARALRESTPLFAH